MCIPNISKVAILALSVTSFFSCKPPAPVIEESKTNFVIVVINGLRADRLGASGYEEATSPNLNSLAKEGYVFDHAYANSSYGRESLSSLIAGTLPCVGNHIGFEAAPAASANTLVKTFKNYGYSTGLFWGDDTIDSYDFESEYDEVHPVRDDYDTGLHESFSSFLTDKGTTGLIAHIQLGLSKESVEVIRNQAALGETNRNTAYDSAVSELDTLVGEITRAISEAGMSENTVVVVTSAHGLELEERGSVGFGRTLYNESIRVPLIFWAPGRIREGTDSRPVSLVDVLPSLRELAGQSAKPTVTSGESLFVRHNRQWEATAPTKRPVYAELMISGGNMIRSVVIDDWKYIGVNRAADLPNPKNWEEQTGDMEIPSAGIWGKPLYEELYNLASDPFEKTNLIGDETRSLRVFRKVLYAYRFEFGGNEAFESDVEDKSSIDSEMTREQLESLGYL